MWEVDIYEATVSGVSESLVVEEIKDLSLSINTSHKLVIPANDASIQLSDGAKIAISSPKVTASFGTKPARTQIVFGSHHDEPVITGDDEEQTKPKTDRTDN